MISKATKTIDVSVKSPTCMKEITLQPSNALNVQKPLNLEHFQTDISQDMAEIQICAEKMSKITFSGLRIA